jgi:hypothetical protein
MTRAQIRAAIRMNLDDAGVTFYQDDEINTSIQDAYNEIAAKTRCIVKSTTLNWGDAKTYYDFLSLGVSDYFGTIAIFNNNSNLWLRDDVNLRDFNRIRRDWETWRGESQFWAPHSFKYTAVCPCLETGSGNFVLWYYAVAPTLVDDTSVPIIATDVQRLFEYYSTADLLETAEEATKASIWWGKYDPILNAYKERCHNLAKSQLLLRI